MVQLFGGFKNHQILVGRGGLEPPTNGLKGRCSTIELPSSKGGRMLAQWDLPRKPNSNHTNAAGIEAWPWASGA